MAAGIGVTLIPQVALDARITRGTGISLSRLEAPASRQIGLAWRQKSLRTEDFRTLGSTMRELMDERESSDARDPITPIPPPGWSHISI